MQDKEMLLEVVPGKHLEADVGRLKALAEVAGLLVGLTVRDGATYISIRYSDEFTEFIRSRNAGRPRRKNAARLSCGEVYLLKESVGAIAAASALRMPIATFYRRCKDNRGKKEGEPFL
jgi:hypothetical protein